MMLDASRPVRATLALSLWLLPGLAAAEDAAPRTLRAGVAGELVEVPGSARRAEILEFDAGLADRLAAVGFEEEVLVAGWPVTPGERAPVLLTRHDVYAPGATIWSLGPEGPRPVPRSEIVLLWGTAATPETRVLVAVEPRRRELSGFSLTLEGVHELRPTPAAWRGPRGQHLLAPPEVFLDEEARAVDAHRTCHQEEVEFAFVAAPSTGGFSRLAEEAITSLHTATIAVDTDNELLGLKFGNDTVAATNYIAQLFAGLNVLYERDLRVRLLQGTTFLRVAAPDPYPSTSTDPAFTKLSEFTGHWSSNHGGVTRALAMMLSGKQSSAFSASGIAWVNALCSSGFGYSFNQVFKFAGSTAAHDVFVVAHEIGHNFGSPHTHCYSPPIDTCYDQNGCYSGPNACPAPQTINGVPNVRGTLMSYCHLLGGCAAAQVFHPTTVALLDPLVEQQVGQCVFPEATPPPCSVTEQDLLLENGSLSTAQTFTACATITARNYVVTPSGDAHLVAGQRVALGDGFRVDPGGELTVEIDPTP